MVNSCHITYRSINLKKIVCDILQTI